MDSPENPDKDKLRLKTTEHRLREPALFIGIASPGIAIFQSSDWTFAKLAEIAQQPGFGHRHEDRSPEITDHDDIAAFASSRQCQLPAITGPVKVENLSRLEIRNLFRGTTRQILLPDVGDAVPGQYVVNRVTPWRPAG